MSDVEDKRNFLLNDPDSMRQSRTVNYKGQEFEVKSLTQREKTQIEEDCQNFDELNRGTAWIMKCLYDPDSGERVFQYPQDASAIEDLTDQGWLGHITSHVLEVNGVQVSDEDLEPKKNRPKNSKNEQGSTPEDTKND